MKIRFLSLLMVTAILIASLLPFYSFASDTTTTTQPSTTQAMTEEEAAAKKKAEVQQALAKRKAEIENDLLTATEKLKTLEGDSKVTQEYIDALDQKIGYINEQLTVLEAENTSIQADIDELTPLIEENEAELEELSAQVEEAKAEIEKLETKFQATYEAYCYRLRVMYISGDYNILSALMSCKDLSSFLTRFEMIKSVSKSDTQLLAEVTEKMEEISQKHDGLNERVKAYEEKKQELDLQKNDYESKQATIEANKKVIADQKIVLASDRAESDSLLAKLTSQNQQYTEFRNEDDELIKQVESDIQALISGVKSPDDIVIPELGDRTIKDTEGSTGGDVYANSNAVLNMTYPAPGYYSVSAGFPNYSSGKYHGGLDFPCPTGTDIVAAQSGIVLTVKRLDYSYGYYVMIYHGTDAQGRSVVTLYAHNSSILVSVGQSVSRGEVIAKSGSTGNSTGPHSHFEIRFDGTRVNPTNYLSR